MAEANVKLVFIKLMIIYIPLFSELDQIGCIAADLAKMYFL